LAVQTEGMVTDIVQHLTDDNKELKKLCASAIFKVSKVLPDHFVNLFIFVGFDVLAVVIMYNYCPLFSFKRW
jgi:hypothetical protein